MTDHMAGHITIGCLCTWLVTWQSMHMTDHMAGHMTGLMADYMTGQIAVGCLCT